VLHKFKFDCISLRSTPPTHPTPLYFHTRVLISLRPRFSFKTYPYPGVDHGVSLVGEAGGAWGWEERWWWGEVMGFLREWGRFWECERGRLVWKEYGEVEDGRVCY